MSSEDNDLRRAARALAEIAHALAAADDSEKRLKTALKFLGQMVPYECCALLEVTPKSRSCEMHTLPPLAAAEAARLRARLIALLRMMGDEQSELVPDLDGTGDGEAASARAGQAPSDRMHLAIPIIGLNQIIGVLFVEQRTEPFEEPYDEHSLRLLSVVAAQIGAYLTTLRLRAEELEHARELGIALRRLQETDRRKDDFLALLGHELRNPLGAINNALRIIDESVDADKTRYHKLIDRQIRHLSRIVDDLLDASRVRLGKVVLDRDTIDLRSVPERWLEAFGSSAPVQSHTVTLAVPEEPVLVDGDAIRLEQTFSNLMTNALKYTPAGGRIAVAIERSDDRALIRVRDSGIGMTCEQLTTVFELFTQADDSLSRSQGGLGLGLPLVRSLVEMHGGTVEATSEGLGRGSEFIVRLPLATRAASDARTVEPVAAPARGAPLDILVVEDNADACETLREILAIWGHRVEIAVDGLAGVARALAGAFEVLLIDIGLPKLDGYEVARRVRAELGPRTPLLVAMTGYGQPEDRRRALDAGFDVYMVKPINAFELQQRLATVAPKGGRRS